MNGLIAAGVAAAFIGAVTATLLVPVVTRVAMAVRALDYPGGRRHQKDAIPRIGGVAIATGILLGAGLPSLLLWPRWAGDVTPFEFAALLFGTGLIFWTGLSEDLVGLSRTYRLVAQSGAAVGVVSAGWYFQVVYIPFWGDMQLGVLGPLITLLWIVGVTNAVNLLDGLDGLASGVAGIIAASVLVLAAIQGDPGTVVLMAAIVGACIGFLRHNWAPARIYMGDAGSLTLGFLLAVMSVHASIEEATAIAILVPILALGLPVFDTLLVMTIRFVEKPHGSLVRRFARMFRADRNHLHHVLARATSEGKRTVLFLYGVAALFCVNAMVVAMSGNETLGLMLVMVELAVILLLRNLGARYQARAVSLKHRDEVRERFVERV